MAAYGRPATTTIWTGRARLLAALVAGLTLSPREPRRQPLRCATCSSWATWEGTADIVDPRTFERLKRLNIIPDYDERLAEIMGDPAALGYFQGINLLIGEGNNQYVDDAFTSLDGRQLYVSRPSLKDVVAFDLATERIIWRFQVDGYRSDHMGISPDVCVGGTFPHRIASHGKKPYWVTNSGDGKYCFISYSGDDRISVVSYATEEEIATVPVGDHPQRMRMGVMRSEFLPQDAILPRILGARVRRGRGGRRFLRIRLSENAVLRVTVERRRRTTRVRAGYVPPPPRKAGAPRVCSPWARVRVLNPVGKQGSNRFPLGKLRAGRRYRLQITATDDAGNRSARKVVRFRIRARRR